MTDLDNLDALAASTDAANVEAQPLDPNAPPPEPTRHEQAVDLVNMFSGMVTSYAPDAAAIWQPEAKEASAAVIAPLLEKYNVSLVNLPPELIAVLVLGPLLYKTAKVVALKIETDKKAAQPARPEQPRNTETPGAAVHSQMGLYA